MTNFLTESGPGGGRLDLVEPRREVVEIRDDGATMVLVVEPVHVGATVAAPGTGGGTSYKHTQLAPDDTWTVTHFLGYIPGGVTVLDGTGDMIIAFGIEHVDENTLALRFTGRPLSGIAYVS